MSRVLSSARLGIDAVAVTVETDISSGLPKFTIVGLPDTAVQESRERVRAALKNSGFVFPRTHITVNLAPADVKKEGPSYDLAIAVSVLAAAGMIPPNTPELEKSIFLGELALDGTLRPTAGVLSAALLARDEGWKKIYLAIENAPEAALIEELEIVPIPSLSELVKSFTENKPLPLWLEPPREPLNTDYEIDFAQIRGQTFAKRALEVAAAGGHNILMKGTPGAGKTLLARALPSILPPLTREESIEVTKIWSSVGLLNKQSPLVSIRPFRSPHHSASAIALVGGGTSPRPGEISLSHHGVLFLDEFPEFKRHVLEHLRQPLEDGCISVSRAAGTLNFPARFMLVAAQNPCPCGFLNDLTRPCQCSPAQVMSYQRKISGPLLDRLDMVIEVPKLKTEELISEENAEASEAIRGRVAAARARQYARGRLNSALKAKELREYCRLEPKGSELLKTAVSKYGLSGRAYSRVLKLSRTIADLAGADEINVSHLSEALQYRPKQE